MINKQQLDHMTSESLTHSLRLIDIGALHHVTRDAMHLRNTLSIITLRVDLANKQQVLVTQEGSSVFCQTS